MCLQILVQDLVVVEEARNLLYAFDPGSIGVGGRGVRPRRSLGHPTGASAGQNRMSDDGGALV